MLNKRQSLEKALKNSTFRHELNTALWMSPFPNEGVLDQGWSCRDHAWIVAALAESYGVESRIFHGKALFTGPRNGKSKRIIMHVGRHSWAAIDGLGYYDLSLKPRNTEPCLELSPVIGNKFLPPFKGTVHIVNDADVYEQRVAQLRANTPATEAIYHCLRYDQIVPTSILPAHDAIQSPLTDWLIDRFGQADYVGLMRHLHKVIAGETTPLAPQGQEAIWQSVMEGAA